MDLNYFHHRQQVSAFMSDNAACDCSRIVHRQMADAYALLITNSRIAVAEDAAALSAAT